MRPILPFLWFDNQALEAVAFYRSVFPDSEVTDTMVSPDGSFLGLTFRLLGREFIALNGGPQYTFTPAVSFLVPCEDQDEIDRLWSRLTEGGREQRCGWLTDRYGLSWQIVPVAFMELMRGADRQGAGRVFQAMMGMVKFDIAALRAAYAAA